jgi:hypothetical protein
MAQCVNCGLLALRVARERALVEADQHYRQTGEAVEGVSSRPLCSVMAFDIGAEINSGRVDSLLQALHVERDCSSFWQWRQ